MTLDDLKTGLKRYGFDDTDPLTMWLNAAMHDLEDDSDWPWLESTVHSLATVAGSNAITLPADVLKIISLRDVSNLRKLEYVDRHRFIREIQDPTEAGKPELYTLINTNQVQLWRVPDAVYSLETTYQGVTPDLSGASDEPETCNNVWPLNAHYPIVQRAASIALQAENEEERAKTAQSEFDQSIMRLRVKFCKRQLDEPDSVVDFQGYSGGIPLRYGY